MDMASSGSLGARRLSVRRADERLVGRFRRCIEGECVPLCKRLASLAPHGTPFAGSCCVDSEKGTNRELWESQGRGPLPLVLWVAEGSGAWPDRDELEVAVAYSYEES